MELLANDQSIDEQFYSVEDFHKAFSHFMVMRSIAQSYGREVRFHQKLLFVEPMSGTSMHTAIAMFPLEKCRAAKIWLSKAGLWNDMRQRTGDDWVECRGKRVTDTAVGEATFRTLCNEDCGLVSLAMSGWDSTPVEVAWRHEGLQGQNLALDNWCNAKALEEALQHRAPPMRSWDDLREVSTKRFKGLIFSEDCFEPLFKFKVPFMEHTANRLHELFCILDKLSQAFDASGERTPEGHEIHQSFFEGAGAPFSDSSDREKKKYCQELTFPHPEGSKKPLFCPWHGKVSHQTLRFHFSWPIKAGKPVYIVYVGNKITKK